MAFFKKFFVEDEVLAWLEWDVEGFTHVEAFTDLVELGAQFVKLTEAGLVATVQEFVGV